MYPSALISANKSCSTHRSDTGKTQTLARDAHTAPHSKAPPPPSPSLPPSPPPRHHHQLLPPLLQLPPFCSPSFSLVLFSWLPSFWQLLPSSSPPLVPLLTPLLVRLVSKLRQPTHPPLPDRHTFLSSGRIPFPLLLLICMRVLTRISFRAAPLHSTNSMSAQLVSSARSNFLPLFRCGYEEQQPHSLQASGNVQSR